jgi:hypothetical protein
MTLMLVTVGEWRNFSIWRRAAAALVQSGDEDRRHRMPPPPGQGFHSIADCARAALVEQVAILDKQQVANASCMLA